MPGRPESSTFWGYCKICRCKEYKPSNPTDRKSGYCTDCGHNWDCHFRSVYEGCFITTATLQAIGKNEDCEELNIFRFYRDTWLLTQKDGEALVAEYYNIAPEIVKIIDAKIDSFSIYKNMWDLHIYPCLIHIQQGEYEIAKAKYSSFMNELKKIYL